MLRKPSVRVGRIAPSIVALACMLIPGGALVSSASAVSSAAVSSTDQSWSGAQQQGAGKRLVAKLRGSKEVPGPGDRNGRGRVVITLHHYTLKVCARVQHRKIGDPVAAHIHKGRPGESGRVVVDLTGAVTGGRNCATGMDHDLIHKMSHHPKRYYFDVHTRRYPAGAIRGQLHRP